MALTDDIRLLSQVPLFRELDSDQLRLIAFGAERRSTSTGQELFRERSPAESAFIICRGSFDLYSTTRDGSTPHDPMAPGLPGETAFEPAHEPAERRNLT